MVNQYLKLEKIEFSGERGQMLSDLVAEMFTEFTEESNQFQSEAKEPLDISNTVSLHLSTYTSCSICRRYSTLYVCTVLSGVVCLCGCRCLLVSMRRSGGRWRTWSRGWGRWCVWRLTTAADLNQFSRYNIILQRKRDREREREFVYFTVA